MASLIPATPDMNQRALSNAMSNYVSSVDNVNKALMMPISILNTQVKYNEDKKAAEERKREWDIANARAQTEFDQKQQDRNALNTYYNEIAKGPQAVGGILNAGEFQKQSDKYSLTQEEIEFSNANKITTADQARALGKTDLAAKMEGQTKLSGLADMMYSQGMLNQSRPEMYESAMSRVVDAGLSVPKEAVASLDAARLAEQTAADAKIKTNMESIAQLNKDQKADLWKLVNARGSGDTITDAEGNTVSIPGLTKEVKADNKAAIKATSTIQDAINKLGLESDDKKAYAIKQTNELVNALVEKNVPIDAAADIVTKSMENKENNKYLSYIGLSDKGASFDKNSINTYADELLKTHKPTDTVKQTNGDGMPSKFDLAKSLVDSNALSTSMDVAKLNAEKDLLLKSPEERRQAKIDSFVSGLMAPAKVAETPTTKVDGNIPVETKAPKALVMAEGVRDMPYKDTTGVTTVGVGYAFNKPRSEIESDFKAAGIPLDKISGLMSMDGKTRLTPKEISSLTDVAYDRHGVQKLKGIGIDISKLDPTLAEIGVVQAYRGDIVKDGDGYRGELYKYLKNNDLEGMKKYVETTKGLPKEVKTRMELTTNREGPITEEQYKYDTAGKLSGKTDWSKFSDSEIADVRNSLNPNSSVDKAILDEIDNNRKIDYKSEAAKLKAQMDSLNLKGMNTNEDILKFKDVQAKYTDTLNRAKEKDKKELYSSNLFELMGVAPKRDKAPRYTLGKDDNAAQTEEGLGDLTATMLPWGRIAEPAMPVISKTLGYAGNKISDVLAPATKGEIVLGDAVTKQLPNFGTKTEWSNPTAIVATNKMEGVGAKQVIEGSSPRGVEADRAISLARQASEDLRNTVPTNTSNLNYFSNQSLDKLNIKNPTDARMLLNGAIEARKNGQLTDEALLSMISKLNDTNLINTRELMEALDKIGFKR